MVFRCFKLEVELSESSNVINLEQFWTLKQGTHSVWKTGHLLPDTAALFFATYCKCLEKFPNNSRTNTGIMRLITISKTLRLITKHKQIFTNKMHCLEHHKFENF